MINRQPIICADGLYKKRNGDVVYLRRQWIDSKFIVDDYGNSRRKYRFYEDVLTGDYWPDTGKFLLSIEESPFDIVEQVY